MTLRLFRRLSTRLAVLYAALFGVTLLLVSAGVYAAINRAAEKQVRSELEASGTVFDRVWSLRSDRLHEGAALLSRDFGFREAVATGDKVTIVSAMDNLRRRLDIDRAFILGVDGHVVGQDKGLTPAEILKLEAAFDSTDDPSGVITLGGKAYQAVSAPVLSPDLIGWVVFAVQLDEPEMSALERLSAIPLEAAVLEHQQAGWRNSNTPEPDAAAVSAFVDKALAKTGERPEVLNHAGGASVALARPLPTLSANDSAALLLRYPLALALAPYQPLLIIVAVTGLLGLCVTGWGSWMLARGLTRPISALDAAAQRLQRGEDAHVDIDSNDEIGRLAASFNTMATAIRDRERRITHLALHDEDTGLPNRRAIEQAIEALDDAQGVYVAALGIQRFEHVRGAIGYAQAAQAVKRVGARLQSLLRGETVARLDADILAFTFKAPTPGAAEAVAAKLVERLEEPLRVGQDTIDVTLNLGLSPLAPGGEGPRHSLELANIGLDQARAAHRKVAFFDAQAYGDPASNLSLMSSMLGALENGEIELFHQPKLDMRSHTVTGVEALVRWRHPVRGLLSPDVFIHMAEETGHIRTLTEWVVRQAIEDQKALARAGYPVAVAVNISGRTLGESDFADFAVARAAEACGQLGFEITETAVIENPELALAMLDRFAEAGIAISIDDYGVGLSSLAYLKQIRGQELKIDKSIVQGVTESQRDSLIVRSTIDLAHSLGFKVTAEGIETEDVFAVLAAMGCDQAQGYLIGKPMALGDLMVFLDAHRAGEASYG
jgi:EAL domain-containing protein (putative c-di-GMP-specific phosphodiesterase class I)/GGDEF domain-containing protein